MRVINNPLHLTTNGDSRILFSSKLFLEGYVCAVTEMKGEFVINDPSPDYSNEWFLCCDFVHESIVNQGTLPALHRIPCKRKTNAAQNRLDGTVLERVNAEFVTNLWIACNRNEVNEVRLYIADANGEVPSFERCDLRCSLICIPKHYL